MISKISYYDDYIEKILITKNEFIFIILNAFLWKMYQENSFF